MTRPTSQDVAVQRRWWCSSVTALERHRPVRASVSGSSHCSVWRQTACVAATDQTHRAAASVRPSPWETPAGRPPGARRARVRYWHRCPMTLIPSRSCSAVEWTVDTQCLSLSISLGKLRCDTMPLRYLPTPNVRYSRSCVGRRWMPFVVYLCVGLFIRTIP